MTDRDKKISSNDDSAKSSDQERDAFIPGKHGKHGGSEESEGSPQEPAPEAERPVERDGSGTTRR